MKIQNQTNPSKNVDAGVDYKLCIIYQKSTSETVIKSREESLVEVLKCMKQYSDLGDPNITSIFKRFGNVAAQKLHSKDHICHKNSYSNAANEQNLSRALERQRWAKKNYDVTFISPKRGRPTSFSPCTSILEESSSVSNFTKCLQSIVTP